jgi:hypothetical protein
MPAIRGYCHAAKFSCIERQAIARRNNLIGQNAISTLIEYE